MASSVRGSVELEEFQSRLLSCFRSGLFETCLREGGSQGPRLNDRGSQSFCRYPVAAENLEAENKITCRFRLGTSGDRMDLLRNNRHFAGVRSSGFMPEVRPFKRMGPRPDVGAAESLTLVATISHELQIGLVVFF